MRPGLQFEGYVTFFDVLSKLYILGEVVLVQGRLGGALPPLGLVYPFGS